MKPFPYLLAAGMLAAVFATAEGQNVQEMPFDVPSGALNVVSSAADEAKTREFYKDILGLPEIAPLTLPGDSKMLRFMGGASELKYILIDPNSPKQTGGLNDGRGIRQLTIFVNGGESVLKRLKDAGYDTASFHDGEGNMLQSGIVSDPDGNEINVVFLPDSLDAQEYKRLRINLTVADMAASRKFYGGLLGLHEESPSSSGGDNMKYFYQAGVTGIRLINENPDLPAKTTLHTDAIGMHYIQFIVRDVQKVYDQMKEKDAKIVREPFALGDMATIFFVSDPDGVIIEFVGPRVAD